MHMRGAFFADLRFENESAGYDRLFALFQTRQDGRVAADGGTDGDTDAEVREGFSSMLWNRSV